MIDRDGTTGWWLRAIVVVAVALLVGALTAPVALAWENPHDPQGNMPGTCAACHRTHTAIGASLLVATTVRNLCDTCHEGYQGSEYDVEAGTINNNGANTPSLAGPFSTSGGATSAHLIDTARNPLYVPGGPNATNLALSCVSCHNPHGTGNYRLFRSTVTWNGLNAGVPNFTATLNNRLATETVTYLTGSQDACSACHPDYARRSGGSYSAGFRHRVGVDVPTSSYTPGSLPLEQQTATNRLVCLTCHYAHGTRVTNTAAGGRQSYSTALKRYPDSALCSGCHFNRW